MQTANPRQQQCSVCLWLHMCWEYTEAVQGSIHHAQSKPEKYGLSTYLAACPTCKQWYTNIQPGCMYGYQLPCCNYLERRSVYFSSLILISLRTLSTAPGSQFTIASISLFASTNSSFLKTLWLRVVQLYCFCVTPCAPLQTRVESSHTVQVQSSRLCVFPDRTAGPLCVQKGIMSGFQYL